MHLTIIVVENYNLRPGLLLRSLFSFPCVYFYLVFVHVSVPHKFSHQKKEWYHYSQIVPLKINASLFTNTVHTFVK